MVNGDLRGRIISRLEDLPTLPFVMEKLLHIVGKGDYSMTEITDIISKDQAISSKVLRVANSAYYGFPRQISDVKQAVVLLGANEVCNIALSVSVFDFFHARHPLPIDAAAFWRYNLGVAVGSVVIGKKVGFTPVRVLYLSGLLHDVGKAVLNFFLPEHYIKVVKACSRGEKEVEVERKVLGVDHCEVGGIVGKMWNFPRHIVSAMRYHCDPAGAQDDAKLVSIVHVAECIIYALGMGEQTAFVVDIEEFAWQTLSKSVSDFRNIGDEVNREFLDAVSAFSDVIG